MDENGDGADAEPIRIPIGGELDLHAFRPQDVPSCVDEFVRAARDAGITCVRLVHGRGHGVQRAIVQAALERHPLVDEFWDDPASHLGATCARLVDRLLGPDEREPD